MRVGEWGGFGDEIVFRRGLIGGGGADEEILADLALEEAEVAVDVSGLEIDEVGYDVEGLVGEDGFGLVLIMDVGLD